MRKRLRNNTIATLGAVGWRPCPTTAIEWHLGARTNPEVEAKVEQISLWFDLWFSLAAPVQHEVLIAWRIALDFFTKRPPTQR